MIKTIKTVAFQDQNPGTSGLRKKVARFCLPHYAENYIQSIFDCMDDCSGKSLVIGGDGRYFNREVLQKLLKMAAANGFSHLIVGRDGLLSTPAASHLIRKYQAQGGIILSASHNPGGREGDFGVKYNVETGGPAPEKITQAIFARSQTIDSYKIMCVPDIDLSQTGNIHLGNMRIEIVDPVADYADLMEEIFDFDFLRAAIKRGLSFCFDAMHAASGPYAREIFENRLGFPVGSVACGWPKEDFGGLHPDPGPTTATRLWQLMMSKDAPDLGAASDGDGDRNMIIGRRFYVTPSDALAVMVANIHHVKAYAGGIVGVARSMPTSRAVDRVAQARGFALYETPTGWKFFSNLMDGGKITLCGEESFGAGSTHLREKDGIWAVLFWLNILAATGQSVETIVKNHWRQFGRHYCLRHDYDEVESERAHDMMADLTQRLPRLVGMHIGGLTIKAADDFTYRDPIDGMVSHHQGIRLLFGEEARLIFRLSGTGTAGATVRLYLEHFEADPAQHNHEPQAVLQPLVAVANSLVDFQSSLGRNAPSTIV